MRRTWWCAVSLAALVGSADRICFAQTSPPDVARADALYKAQQKWSAAIVDLAKALKLNSGDTNAYYWLTKALMAQGAYPDALRAVDLYIESDVDDADGHFMRAQIEEKLGDADQARISATNAQRHYMIVNDQAGAAKAQALLDSLGKAFAVSGTAIA